MTDILVRNVDPNLLGKLRQQAQQNNRSLQAEIGTILSDSVRMDTTSFLQAAANIRTRLAGRTHTDSPDLIREDRS